MTRKNLALLFIVLLVLVGLVLLTRHRNQKPAPVPREEIIAVQVGPPVNRVQLFPPKVMARRLAAAGGALTLTPPTCPNGTVGQPYSCTLVVSGGGPYTWSSQGTCTGKPDPGLTITISTTVEAGDTYTISGTPTIPCPPFSPGSLSTNSP